jgi:ubiquinone biosynthesis protein COQ9
MLQRCCYCCCRCSDAAAAVELPLLMLYTCLEGCNACFGLVYRLLLQLLDEIWYSAGGDTSTDASWYTKRASLAAVYMSTELYMLTDYSPGYADTWQQLERRMQDALWLGSAAAAADTHVLWVAMLALVLCITWRN